MRNTFFFLGLVALAVGTWLLFRTSPSGTACGAPRTSLTAVGVSPICQNLLASYVMAYALLIGGLMIVLLTALSLAKYKRRRNDYYRDIEPIARRRVHDANESERRAA
jgi:hypothetical protein